MRRRRDSRLIEKRNAKIAARYYYWTEKQRLRSDDAIRQLSEEEFFLNHGYNEEKGLKDLDGGEYRYRFFRIGQVSVSFRYVKGELI